MIQKFFASVLLLFSVLIFNASAQDGPVQTRQYPQGYFMFPLDLAPATVGSFAELRPNHFHSGLDLRTNQRTGYPVHAAAEGFVSRLRVQFGGFGNALYITHPNGYTTVYGHLQSFSPEIAQLVHQYQIQQKCDIVDFNLMPMQMHVDKGQVVALSGATGAVAGPHLHFEIRDTETEQTINPQLFGVLIPDSKPPILGTACVYRMNGQPFSEKTPREFLPVVGAGGHYHLANPHVLNLSGDIGFGITAYDLNNTSASHNGVYSIELKLDGKTVYTFAAERFAFDQTHAINAYIDYPEFLNTHRFIQKCFILPGSHITLYPQSINRGIISFTDDSLHEVEYVVKDIAGNTSTLSLKVRSGSKVPAVVPFAPKGTLFHYDQRNEFSTDKVKVIIQPGNLYDDADFTFAQLPKRPGAFSPVYHIGTRFTNINDSYDLWIKPDSTQGNWRGHKAVIISTAGAYEGGEFKDGYVKAQPHTFGDFYVRLDTTPPYITPVNLRNGGNMAGKRSISFRIGDALSGVKTYYGYLDGKWVLMFWDFKSKLLNYNFDDSVTKGKHNFELDVTDQKGNTASYKADFYR